MSIILDAQELATRRSAHEYLKQQLQFPEYYGMNLDALFDCLTDLGETEVQFINLPEEEDEETYFDMVKWVFAEAAKRNSRLTIKE